MLPQPGRRPNLYGMDRSALAAWLGELGAPGFHAGQIQRWLYARRRFDPREWTDLPQALRERIRRDGCADPGRVVERLAATDGTVKFRVSLAGGGQVECVRMRQSGRTTLCVSSQVGCALDCAFCLTGKMGLTRNLDPGEIAGQVALLHEEAAADEGPPNVVFMGMGEPLHNYDAVVAALGLLVDPDGFALSRRRITVSTSGLAPAIERLATAHPRPRLAVSLNATTDEVRSRIMPINRRYGIERLLAACRAFADASGERFTLEYVLLAGVNDTDADARRLPRLLHGLPAKLNLIPFNPVPGWLDYAAPPRTRVLEFRDRLLAAGLAVSVRFSRGLEARAACGQLALLG